MSTLSSLDSTTINNAVSQMSDTELCGVLSTINHEEEIDSLIKCDRESLDKIYRVKRENVDEIIKKDATAEADEDTQRVMKTVIEFSEKENPAFDDYMKVSKEMIWMISVLKEDNERCESDITSLELAYEKMRENFFMYEEDLCEDSLKVCKEKMEYTEGLIRLRYKTFEINTESISGLEKIVKSMVDNGPMED